MATFFISFTADRRWFLAKTVLSDEYKALITCLSWRG